MELLSEIFSGTRDDDTVHVIQILALNNQTQLLNLQGQLAEANAGWGSLRTMLPLLECKSEEERKLVGDDIFGEIVLNLLVPVSKIMAAAA